MSYEDNGRDDEHQWPSAFISNQDECERYADALQTFARWAWTVSNSGTHRHNAYHNMAHTHRVVQDSILIYQHETGKAATPELIFAAHMHDYNHSGGTHPDSVNIERALAGVERFRCHPRLSHVNIDTVKTLIECTYFDGTGFPNEPTTVEAMALRDADLMELYSENAVSQLHGLYIEMLKRQPDLTAQQYIDRSYAFLKDATFYTSYGKRVKEEQFESYFMRFRVGYQQQESKVYADYENYIRGIE